MTLSSRDRVLAAIRRQPVDRVPTDYWGTAEITDKLYRHLGCDTRQALYDCLGIDGIPGAAPPYVGPPLPDPEAAGTEVFQAWGIRFKQQHYEGGVYWEQAYNPLAGAETLSDLQSYRWPDPDWFDYSALPDLCAQYPDRAVQVGYTAVFYLHNMLRGLQLSLMDPLLRPEFTHYLVARISEWFTEYHQRCFQAAQGCVDVTQVTDDWGSQHGLLVSPRVFEEFYRAPTQRAIDLAKSYGILVFHHDDGDMRPLLPTLAEMGIDTLNPIQWRCGDWDLGALKRDFGGQLCFHGGIDNQHTLPHGTPDEVRAEVQRLIESLATDGTGYILAPCHNIQSITPVENVVAMYETACRVGTEWAGQNQGTRQ
jgi:uroporphyrinogen decarboxylase